VSLSISSSNTLTSSAVISPGGRTTRYGTTELRLAKRICLLSPLFVLVLIPLVHRYLLWVLYLQPVETTWEIQQAFRSKPAIAVAFGVGMLPWLWLIGIKVEASLTRTRIPWSLVLAVIGIVTMSILLNSSRATWFFVEWAKVRTPNPSFARNTLFWEQRNFGSSSCVSDNVRVGLVGSSQTYQGLDAQELEAVCPQMCFEKNCLAGFGPMQYPFLANRIGERGFDVIVCQLSEFDFFREDAVPANRLRWAASLQGTSTVASTLNPFQLWRGRGALADLAFASVSSMWRQRDHFSRTLMGYWWKKSEPPPEDKQGETRLANAPVLALAIDSLKKNIGHKELVEANFRAFQIFAEQLQLRNVKLMVVEGQVHPLARKAYDTDNLQVTTRNRLAAMADELQFTYFDSIQMPLFTSLDFADAYHLNSQGRSKLTTFVASELNKLNTEY
jgi:hypothetical protein